MKGGAVFGGENKEYRYVLSRLWGTEEEVPLRLTWVMLNPSTAGVVKNDPTIHNCMAITKREGYDGLYVVNLFAYRSPDPDVLKTLLPQVRRGPDNDLWIKTIVRRTPSTIVAWGNAGAYYPKRVKRVLEILREHGTIRCLGLTARGQPRHPARLSRETQLEEFHA